MLDTDLTMPIELLPGESDDDLYRLTLAAAQDWDSDERRQTLPRALDGMAPGPFLGAILSAIDISRLRGHDVVTVLRAQQRQVSHHQAGLYDAMAEAGHCVDPETTERSAVIGEYASEEVGTALHYTRRKADHELGIAYHLRTRLPAVRVALDSGLLDPARATVLCLETGHLDNESAQRVVDMVLPEAGELTTGQLRARVTRLCFEVDPENARLRMEDSLSRRRVVAEPNAEGTATFIISECSPDQVYMARDHVNMLARRLKTEDESRNIDQLRADVAMALLSGAISADGESTTSRRAGAVTLQVDMTTLAGLDNRPGELDGCGPIVAELARKVAEEQRGGHWTAVVTDPETGEPLHVVSLRRRPTNKQTRMIRALHPTCVFPGCRMPAIACDLDHTLDHARGGPTTVGNHAPLCRRHHMAKHEGRWRYRREGRITVEWRSPLGHRYRIDRPP